MSRYTLFQRIIEKGEYSRFLDYACFFYRYQHWSLFNSALSFLQRPGSVCLLSEEEWKRLGRNIIPTSIPVVIMQYFGPVAFVYDLVDTEGESIPDYLQTFDKFIRPEPQPITDRLLPKLQKLCKDLGIKYIENPMGTSRGGEAGILPEPMIIRRRKKGDRKRGGTKKSWFYISINTNANNTRKAFALSHELGHILCGHLRLTKEQQKDSALNIPNREQDYKSGFLNSNSREWEADKVLETACMMLGLKYDSSEYLEGYGYGRQGDSKPGSLRVVLDAADEIIKRIDTMEAHNKKTARVGKKLTNVTEPSLFDI